ncbi:hypothetical protein IAU59_007625 [Kwoniella sp. CBS 9459]
MNILTGKSSYVYYLGIRNAQDASEDAQYEWLPEIDMPIAEARQFTSNVIDLTGTFKVEKRLKCNGATIFLAFLDTAEMRECWKTYQDQLVSIVHGLPADRPEPTIVTTCSTRDRHLPTPHTHELPYAGPSAPTAVPPPVTHDPSDYDTPIRGQADPTSPLTPSSSTQLDIARITRHSPMTTHSVRNQPDVGISVKTRRDTTMTHHDSPSSTPPVPAASDLIVSGKNSAGLSLSGRIVRNPTLPMQARPNQASFTSTMTCASPFKACPPRTSPTPQVQPNSTPLSQNHVDTSTSPQCQPEAFTPYLSVEAVEDSAVEDPADMRWGLVPTLLDSMTVESSSHDESSFEGSEAEDLFGTKGYGGLVFEIEELALVDDVQYHPGPFPKQGQATEPEVDQVRMLPCVFEFFLRL